MERRSGRPGKTFIQQHKTQIDGFVTTAGQFLSIVFSGVVAIPILALFFLSDGEKLTEQVVRLVSRPSNHGAIQSLVAELDLTLQHYIRAKVILALLSFTFSSLAMLLLGFSESAHARPACRHPGIHPRRRLDFRRSHDPYLRFVTHAHWIWMLLLLVVWRLFMDYLIAPKVMGHELELHPLLAIFIMMIGGAVGGIIGIYLSIPLIAVVRVIWRRFLARSVPAATSAPLLEPTPQL